MGDDPPFKEFQKQRDAANDAVEKAWKFPYPAAAVELAAEAAAEAIRAEDSRAGKASGLKRLEKAEGAWRYHALDLAKAIRMEQPGISQKKLATEIAFRWKLEERCRRVDANSPHW